MVSRGTPETSMPTRQAKLPAGLKTGDPDRPWRVLLINPPFQRLKGVYNLYFPLGLGYLAGSLKRAGFECGIYNAENARLDEVAPHNHLSLLEQHWKYVEALNEDNHYVWQEVRQTIKDFKPDVLGVSVMTPVYGSAVKVNKIAKELFPNLPIIWGGPHPTVQDSEILADEAEVDMVVMGEGEITTAEICTFLRNEGTDPAVVDGIAYRADGKYRCNQPRPLMDDLDSLPWPDKKASLYMEAYFRDPERAQLGNLFGSRGCPFKCAYCSSHTIWGRKVRYRTPENLVAEMKALQDEFGVERFSFLDDTFTMNHKWTSSICERIRGERIKGRWSCYTRLDVLTEELLARMSSAGLAQMDVGIETGSQRMVDFLEKGIRLDRVREMAAVLNRRRINWNAFIMMGLPEEQLDDIQATVDFIHEVRPVRCILSIFTPYPGARLYNHCKESGLIPEKPTWSRFSHHSPENHFVKDLSKEDFAKLTKQVFVLIDRYNNSWSANYRLLRANSRLYARQPIRFLQKALSAAGRMVNTRIRTKVASMDLARGSGRGPGI